MNTEDTTQIKERLKALEQEVSRLRSRLNGGDPEGEYKEEFVEKALAAADEEPEFTFTDAESFQKQLESVRKDSQP
jgi:predicted nuclease with TOPRIM domain